MAKARFISIFLLLGVIYWISCGTNDNTIVARVDNFTIHLGDLKEQTAGKPARKAVNYEEILERLVNNQLKIIEAYRLGIDKEEDIQVKIAETEKRLVYNALIEKQLIEKFITESDLKDYYKRSSREVLVRQVFISLPTEAAEKEVTEARQLLTEARKRIFKGEGFEKIVEQYSNDSTLIKSGGSLGFLAWGSSLYDIKLVEEAFKMKKGAVSLPFRTSNGFHLIKVEEIKQTNQKPYKDLKEKIKQLFFKQKRKKLEEAYYAMIDKYKSEYGIQYEDENIHKFAEDIKNYNTKPDSSKPNKDPKTGDQFDGINEEDKELPLVTNKYGSFITIGKMVKEIRRFPPYKQPRLNDEKVVKEWLDRMVPYELFILIGYKLNLQNNPEVKNKIKDQIEKLMLSRIENQEIQLKVKPTESDFEEFYKANSEKYKKQETVEVQEVFVKNKSVAAEIATRAKRGENFDALADQYNERSTTKNNHGMLGFIRKTQYGNIGKTAFEMQVGDIAGPVKMGGNFSVIKILDRQPERIITYEEAKSQVRSDVKIKMRKDREHEWLESLRTKSNVQIYRGVLQKAFPSEEI